MRATGSFRDYLKERGILPYGWLEEHLCFTHFRIPDSFCMVLPP